MAKPNADTPTNLARIGAALNEVELDLDLAVPPSTRYEGGSGGWQAAQIGSRLSSGEMVPGTRFKIVRWIGEGGMGQVFEAEHIDIQRRVALKVLKSNLGLTDELSAAFLAEARACARVESRFVVQVLDFGELPDGRPFFAMELLERYSLDHALLPKLMALPRAIPILRQCCKALAAIHDAGLVHRDIKPKNVMLEEEEGRADVVRIVDFGIAAERDSVADPAGTPAYMSPEQIEDRSFDGRSDIYSLGCMAYEMLAGRPPFVGDSDEVLDHHLDDEPPPISTLAPELPDELDAILLRCLAKDPDDRWPNPHELEAALCEVQIAVGFISEWDLPMPEVEASRRAKLAESMPRSGRQGRWRWWVGVGVAVALSGLVAGLIIAKRGSQDQVRGVAAAGEAPIDRIDELTAATRTAAAKAYWVYPPNDDPDQKTALHWIRRLETEQGPTADQASTRANELRHEIADTLVRFGDRYWAAKNGRSFALEFYAIALIFVPDHARAQARSPLTPTQLADITSRASRGEFSPAELRTANVLQVLVEEDTDRRRRRAESLIATRGPEMSVRVSEELTELVGVDASETGDEAETETEPEVALSEGETEGIDETGGEDDPPEQNDPAQAAALVKEARDALARRERARALRLLNSAIAHDRRSTAALTALAEFHFDDGNHAKALDYARKASALRPKDGELHLLVGDCYLKVLRYGAAQTAYEKAEKLDHPRAAQRLEYLAGLTQ